MSEMVKLKNGTEELGALVGVTMISLRALIGHSPIAFYELAMVCRDPQHKPFGDMGERLARLGLLQADGRPHTSIKNIVLSAVGGEGLDLELGDPVQR